MTREEAIRVLEDNRPSVIFEDENAQKQMAELCQAIDMAIEALQEVQKHEETFEWCSDCKEFDKENYCCHRWSKEIRNTVEELKAVVRCKDCKFRRTENCAISSDMCLDAHDYCAFGERRNP